jgi:arsenite methyltransferase
MQKNEEIRERVSRDYAEAVKSTGGCCGDSKKTATVADLAGYKAEDLAALPDAALASSFGCGNPLAFSQVGEGETVLDLGSGAGVDLIIAARKVGPTGRVIGVDMTDEMIDAARRNIASAGLDNVELRKGIIEELPVSDASVDWVISNCVINLSPQKDRVFGEIARVLKPGGRMQVSDIVAEELPVSLRESASAHSACLGGAISEAEYCEGLRGAGLESVEVPERLVYEDSQLMAMADELGVEVPQTTSCCGGDAVKALMAQVSGNVWSAQFRARKPE